jgi:hypothetical protein
MSTRQILLSVTLGLLATGFLFGAATTASERDSGKETGCVYKSVASIINPGYILGCEFFRKRFEVRP